MKKIPLDVSLDLQKTLKEGHLSYTQRNQLALFRSLVMNLGAQGCMLWNYHKIECPKQLLKI